MNILLALLIGVVTIHDLRHVVQVGMVTRRYRVPLGVLSTLAVVARQWLMWTAHLAHRPWHVVAYATLGHTLIMYLYSLDIEAIRRASALVADREQEGA